MAESQDNKDFSSTFIKVFRTLLPSPFTIAIVLTLVTVFMCLMFGEFGEGIAGVSKLKQVGKWWETGLWNGPFMIFAMQAMIMLVLGHILTLSRPVAWLINKATSSFCTSTASAAFMVTLLTIIAGWLNWGVGLIFGAIFARKVAEYAAANNVKLNYPIIGACGYVGLMVWHGGLSGSSLFKIAEPGHLAEMMDGLMDPAAIAALPNAIPYSETVFTGMNLTVTLALLIFLPLTMWFIAKRSKPQDIVLPVSTFSNDVETSDVIGAEKLDYSKIFGVGVGVVILIVALLSALDHPQVSSAGFIQPNWINLVLLGLCLTLHGRFVKFLRATDDAISGASGILIQFPLYFGIMGLMKSSGMVHMMSDFFVSISNETSYPIFTFISAGLVNIFVPSGGGQWAVQGPIIVQSAQELGVPLTKSILAMAYGDQLTNMLQPFWALPLLGITGLKAKDILPYTLILMLVGIAIFVSALLIF